MNTDLKELIYGGTTTITRDDGSVEEVETESLLTQLETIKTIRKGEGGGNKTSAPVGLDPVVIEQEIIDDINTHTPNECAHIKKLPLRARILAWWEVTKAPDKPEIVFAWCELIRQLDYKYVVVQGSCPACGQARVRKREGHETLWQDALICCAQTQVASCRGCGETWEGWCEISRLGEVVRNQG